jgi:hypothetical protein
VSITAFISWVTVVLLLGTATGLLLNRDWRWSLALLAAQYLGLFWLVQLHWPVPMAAVKLVTGWMAAAALGMTQTGLTQPSEEERSWPQGTLFRLLAAGLVVLVILSIAQGAAAWLPGAGQAEITGGLLLAGMGLLHLGITAQPFRIVLGLLTALGGFEILYATVESSIMVAALLAAINLGLALVGAYLLSVTAGEEAD